MEARGLHQKDLAALIGSQPRASEVLNRHRPLTLPMIRGPIDRMEPSSRRACARVRPRERDISGLGRDLAGKSEDVDITYDILAILPQSSVRQQTPVSTI